MAYLKPDNCINNFSDFENLGQIKLNLINNLFLILFAVPKLFPIYPYPYS